MRLAGQEKLGFYAIPELEVDGLVKHLALGPANEKSGEHFLLDPCAGEGVAIRLIADALKVPYKNVYAVEMNRERGVLVRENLPGGQILAPCDFFSTLIGHRSFGCIYANPPFDSAEIGRGNGREETRFLTECHSLLVDNGVIVFVAPLQTYKGKDFRHFAETHFKDILLYRFEKPIYNEVVMFARKRANALHEDESYKRGVLTINYKLEGGTYGRSYDYDRQRYKGINALLELPAFGSLACDWVDGCPGEEHKTIRVYDIPPCYRPYRFAKADYLDEELIAAVEESSNQSLYRAMSEPDIAEAPLPLAEGHVALLVASGALDGLIEVPGRSELNHVMRGIARKVEQLNEEAGKCVLAEDGKSMRVTEVMSETMDTKIRCIDKTSKVFTFGLEPVKNTKTREQTIDIEKATGECESPVVIYLVRDGNSDYINIDCGGKTIKFCFDTGAEICQLSSADLKGCAYFPTGRTFNLVGAAGLGVPAKEVLICRMEVAGLVCKNVRCAVTEPLLGEVPALLGQNFLRMFDYTYFQNKGRLTLTLAKEEEEEDGDMIDGEQASDRDQV